MMKKRTAYDFKFIRTLGEGSFSSVYLAVDADELVVSDGDSDCKGSEEAESSSPSSSQNESGIELELDLNDSVHQQQQKQSKRRRNKVRKYAIKVCQKSYIKRQNKQVAIMREKEIMNILNQHPNEHFIKLHCTFQDLERLYFVMTYAENGELLNYMQKQPLSIEQVRRYTLQLVSALEHMHSLSILHRDLKPENILLNEHMNLLITDFGSAQIYVDKGADLKASADRRNSFVGTAQYVSPEMLKSRLATNMSDLWALGVIVFQMITNEMPFNAPNEYLIYQKIQSLDYEYPDTFDPIARKFTCSLIKLEPADRLGAADDVKTEGYPSLRVHPFLAISEYPDCVMQSSPSTSLSPAQINNDGGLLEEDPDLLNLDKIKPGLDEAQLLRLLTFG